MEAISYKFPNSEILIKDNEECKTNIEIESNRIERFFENYNIDIDCKDVYIGTNTITYIIDLKCKTKVGTIKNYRDDLMLHLNAIDVKFQIAINRTPYLGVHIIKSKDKTLMLGNLINSQEFIQSKAKVPIIIGKDFNNKIIIDDLVELPHLLISGTTGTGKSNFLSTIIVDILYKLNPSEVKLVLIDTRKTNFKRFNKLPHLFIPLITEPKKVIGILDYLIEEMYKRYKLFENKKVDNIEDYNKIVDEKIPRIIVLIEDFYDVMIETEKEAEIYIKKLIQMCRASGINIIISTQRPSTDVITGLIKANISSRIAFKVPSKVDSKTIIDVAGAEELLICGEVLYTKVDKSEILRIQTPYISDKEIENIVREIEVNNELDYDKELVSLLENYSKNNDEENYDSEYDEDEIDSLLLEAIESVIEVQQASTSFIQRRFKVGYARACIIIDQMEANGVISGYEGSKPRQVLITIEEWNDLKNNANTKGYEW